MWQLHATTDYLLIGHWLLAFLRAATTTAPYTSNVRSGNTNRYGPESALVRSSTWGNVHEATLLGSTHHIMPHVGGSLSPHLPWKRRQLVGKREDSHNVHTCGS